VAAGVRGWAAVATFHVCAADHVLIVLPLAVRLARFDHKRSSLRVDQDRDPGLDSWKLADTLGP